MTTSLTYELNPASQPSAYNDKFSVDPNNGSLSLKGRKNNRTGQRTKTLLLVFSSPVPNVAYSDWSSSVNNCLKTSPLTGQVQLNFIVHFFRWLSTKIQQSIVIHQQQQYHRQQYNFFFFLRSTFVGSAWSFGFSSPPQRPMTSDFERF